MLVVIHKLQRFLIVGRGSGYDDKKDDIRSNINMKKMDVEDEFLLHTSSHP